MTKDEVLILVREVCEHAGGYAAWAKTVGVSSQYIADVAAGRREPGPAVLNALGLEKVVTYRRIRHG